MINSQLVKDYFGQSYIIHSRKDRPAPLALKAEWFRSNDQARRFINDLKVSPGFWQKIYYAESLNPASIQGQLQLVDKIAELLARGKLKIYKCDMPSSADHPPEKRTLVDNNKNKHTFIPASTLLVNSPKEIKTFNSQHEAREFIAELAPDKKQLKEITTELGVAIPINGNGATEEMESELSSALMAGTVVVMIDRYAAPPRPEELVANDSVAIDKKADLGPPPDEFKEITIEFEDEFEKTLAAHFSLFNGLEYTLKTDMGEEQKGVIEDGKIHIDKIKMNKTYKLKIKDLPAFMDI